MYFLHLLAKIEMLYTGSFVLMRVYIMSQFMVFISVALCCFLIGCFFVYLMVTN